MGGIQMIRCVSCGYGVGTVPGRHCTQKKWHKPNKQGLKVYGEEKLGAMAEDWTSQQMGVVPGWVRARVYVEAMAEGISSNQKAGQILEEWALKNKGKP